MHACLYAYVCVHVCVCTCMFVCCVCRCSGKPEKTLRSLGAGVKGGREMPGIIANH